MSSRGPALIVLSLVLLAISISAIILRIISRRIRKRPFKIDDYLVFLSLFCLTGYVIDILIGTITGGYGNHTMEMSPDKLMIALKTFFICEWFRATSVAAFRLGILCLYVEIFHQGETFFWVATGAGVLVFLYWVACILTVALLCRPVASNWDLRIPRTCGSVIKTEFASAGFNLGIDLWVVMLPLPIVWRLHMSSRKKLGVMASFALGIVTAGINLGRAIQTRLCPYDDLIYCMRDSIILVFAEIATSILVACVPTLGPLLFRRWSGTRPRPNIASHTIGSARAKKPFERLDEEDLEFDESRGTWRLRVRDLSTRHLDLLCLVVAAVQCGSYVTIRFLAFVSAFFISSLSVS